MIIAMLLQGVVLIAAGVIIARAEPALNRMGRHTPLMIRVAMHLLVVAAIGEIVVIVGGDVPSWSAALMTSGAASLLVCERRLRVLCPPPRRRISQ